MWTGCGGDPQIIALRNSGASGQLSATKLYELTKLIDLGEWNVGHILLAACDLSRDDKAVRKEIMEELKDLEHLRKHYRFRDQTHYSGQLYKKLDSLGLPIRKEEGQTD